MTNETKTELQRRLKRAAGQLSGIQRMVDEDSHCVDVLIQIAAVRGALHKVGQILLAAHVRRCVVGAFDSGDTLEREKTIEELIEVFARYTSGG